MELEGYTRMVGSVHYEETGELVDSLIGLDLLKKCIHVTSNE